MGCDLHARQQAVAMLDTKTGEVSESRVLSAVMRLCENEILSASWTSLGFALVAMIRPKLPG
jgi:hypothetical protein